MRVQFPPDTCSQVRPQVWGRALDLDLATGWVSVRLGQAWGVTDTEEVPVSTPPAETSKSTSAVQEAVGLRLRLPTAA